MGRSIIRGAQEAATLAGTAQSFPANGFPEFTSEDPIRGALVFGSHAVTLGTALTHARLSVGFTDGTRHRCLSLRCRDNQAFSDTTQNGFNDRIFSLANPTATTALNSFALSALNAASLSGDWASTPASAYLVNTLLFGGSGCQVYVGQFTASASTNGTTVVDATSDPNFNFQFDLLFTSSRGTGDFTGTAGTHVNASYGVCVGSNLAQGCVGFSSDHNTTTEISGAMLNTNRVAQSFITGGPTAGDSVEITTRSSVGFTATKRGANGTAPIVAFMAVKLPGVQGIKLYTTGRDTLTSAGADTWTDAGHRPQFLFSLCTSATAADAIASGTTDACLGLGAACGPTTAEIVQFSTAIMADDGLGTTDTNSITDSKIHNIPTQAAGTGTIGNITAFSQNGATLDYSSVLASARAQLILSVGASLGPGFQDLGLARRRLNSNRRR